MSFIKCTFAYGDFLPKLKQIKKALCSKMLNMRLHMKYSICSKIRYKNLQTAKIATFASWLAYWFSLQSTKSPLNGLPY